MKGMKKWFLGLFLVGIVVSFVFLPALMAENFETTAKGNTVIITISVINDQVVVSPDPAYVDCNSKIVWECSNNLPFSVIGDWDHIFEKLIKVNQGLETKIKRGVSLKYPVKYTVGVYNGEEVLLLDPIIIFPPLR